MNIDKDLINFINQEKQFSKISSKQLITYFVNCFKKSIIDLDSKFVNIKNKQLNIISGTNMLYHIFLMLICYTNNIKLTKFLIDRAILLFTEFIIMSQDKKIIEDICFIPDITDAISFCYKKTIGSIKIEDIKTNNINFIIEEIFKIFLNIYINIFIYSISESDKIYNYDNLDLPGDLLLNIFIEIFTKKKKYNRFILDYINTILAGLNEKPILDKIIIIRIVLEIMLIYQKKHTENFIIFFKSNFDVICDTPLSFKKNLDFSKYILYKKLFDRIPL